MASGNGAAMPITDMLAALTRIKDKMDDAKRRMQHTDDDITRLSEQLAATKHVRAKAAIDLMKAEEEYQASVMAMQASR